MEDRVSVLENKISPVEVIEVSAVSPSEAPVEVKREEAKREILKLFELNGDLDYLEIVSNLGLDLKLVVEICEELEKEKKIAGMK